MDGQLFLFRKKTYVTKVTKSLSKYISKNVCQRSSWLRGHRVSVVVDYANKWRHSHWLPWHDVSVVVYDADIVSDTVSAYNDYANTTMTTRTSTANFEGHQPTKKEYSYQSKHWGMFTYLIVTFLTFLVDYVGQANFELYNRISSRKRKTLWNCFSLSKCPYGAQKECFKRKKLGENLVTLSIPFSHTWDKLFNLVFKCCISLKSKSNTKK